MMKRKIRKALSLVLTVALLCSLIPAAFAYSATDYTWDTSTCTTTPILCYMLGTHTPATNTATTVCNMCNATGYVYGYGTGGGTVYDHNHILSYTPDPLNSALHYTECHVSGCDYTAHEAHNSACSCTTGSGSTVTHDHQYVNVDGTYHYVTCTNPVCPYYGGKYEAHNSSCTCLSGSTTNHNHQYTYYDLSYHWVACSIPSCEYYGGNKLEAHNSRCNCDPNSSSTTHNHQYTKFDDTYHWVSCTNPTCQYYGGNKLEAHNSSCNCTSTGNLYVQQFDSMPNDTYTLNESVTLSVSPSVWTGTAYSTDYNFTYLWAGDVTASGSSSSVAYLNTSKSSCVVSCTVTATDKVTNAVVGQVTVTWAATAAASVTVAATVYNTNAGYQFGDADDKNGTSVADQIYYALYTKGYVLSYVQFGTSVFTGGQLSAIRGTSYYYNNYSSYWLDDLNSVMFYPTSGYTGTVTVPFTAYCTSNTSSVSTAAVPVDGAITFTVEEGSTGLDIVYTALKGNTVALNEEDFEGFWAAKYPFGTLNYVRFTSVSSGNLYDSYASGSLRTDVRARNSSCYLDPAGTQIGLDDLTYVPAAYGNISTVTIQFTAYGSSSYSGYGSYGNANLSGTITILYTASEVTPIQYQIGATNVVLDATDFVAKYKEVMGVNYANNLTIQLLDAPTYGSLYYNSGYYQSSGVLLTAANINNYTFSTSTTSSTSIEKLTYIPGNAGDTIRFVCYSGNAPKFLGTITFGSAEKYIVELTTTAGKAVNFTSDAFANADSSSLLTSGYIYLGTPNAGALYKNYANGTGTRVTTSDRFTASTLNQIAYVPRAGYIGVVEIPFTAYTYLGSQVGGTIHVYVGRAFTDVLGTSSAWAAPYINKLSAQGIVNGTDTAMTKYSPTKTVTYGEALKLIMMAAGYPEQGKTNTHWASGYLTKAYYDGLVSSSAIDLNAEVTRETIAEITAKALKLNYATKINAGITGPTDSANGYVYALYNAGIINGVNQNGKNYFLGSNSITRAEISKIICMVADYEK